MMFPLMTLPSSSTLPVQLAVLLFGGTSLRPESGTLIELPVIAFVMAQPAKTSALAAARDPRAIRRAIIVYSFSG
ncbi:MAG: hypothetical protein H0W40_02070 [Methylibium sp.]|uniref:hypothetical protein n=1 Tax=Methylibium sp. TaxID=2067992 RepID=UPI00178E41F2|nr:hypothetical protein [Methylibium sp.]MBA3596154.1 hypothetical protein [Methylibium sp.]